MSEVGDATIDDAKLQERRLVGRQVARTAAEIEALPPQTVIIGECELRATAVFQNWGDGWYGLGYIDDPWTAARLLRIAPAWTVVWP